MHAMAKMQAPALAFRALTLARGSQPFDSMRRASARGLRIAWTTQRAAHGQLPADEQEGRPNFAKNAGSLGHEIGGEQSKRPVESTRDAQLPDWLAHLRHQAEQVLARVEPVQQKWNEVKVSPYGRLMRLDKPIGSGLLFWPGALSIAMVAPPGSLPSAGLLCSFAVGSVLLRGVGCTVNDILDRDIDARVERTKNRPVASGEVSVPQAAAFAAAQAIAAAPILLFMNPLTIGMGIASLVPVGLYPLAKRHVPVPQAVLGLTFNWGALLGWSAATGSLAVTPLLLYGSCVCWTMVYDTIYAFQDKEEDRELGIQSSALFFANDGAQGKRWLSAFAAGQISLLSLSGWMAQQPELFYVGVACASTHLFQQIYLTDLNNKESCMKAFKSNNYLGVGMFAAIVIGNLMR